MKAIGIDIGTTSVCGVVVDVERGLVIDSVTKNSDAFTKTENSWEKIQSVEKIIAIAKEILDGFISDDVVAIGVTGQMHGIVYTNVEGDAVSPLYIWQDERGNLPYKDTTYAKHLNSYSGYGTVTDFYNRENGIRPDSAVSFCTIHDYFVMKLCGLKKAIMHSTDAASYGCYDLRENKFNYDVNVDVTADFTVAGTYNGIPVSVAIGDNQASVFSTLANEENILLNVGTGSQISVISDTIAESDEVETRPYFDGKYLIVGAALCGGRAYSVLKNFYKAILSYKEALSDNEVYDIMNKMLSKEAPCVSVDTRFAGTRKNPDLSGSISEVREESFTPEAFTKGVLSGMATELYDMYAQMGVTKSGIVGSGNGVRKNKALVRIFEEKFGGTMKMPVHLEEAAVGAALFSLVAAGICETAQDAQKMIKYE